MLKAMSKNSVDEASDSGLPPRTGSASSNPVDLDYFKEHGHIKMEDAQSLHCLNMRHHGITDPDEIIADWNRRDPEAPWGSGIAGKYVGQLTELVCAFMRDKIREAQSRQNAKGDAPGANEKL